MTEQKRRTSRRGNGEGAIFKRADGRWVARLPIGYDTKGKRLTKTVYGKTKKEVQDKLLELQQRKRTGLIVATCRDTVAVFLEEWLTTIKRVEVWQSTFNRYQQLVHKHINPRIGGVRLERLTTDNANHIYADMEANGLKPRTRRFVHFVLSNALDAAVIKGLVPKNICNFATVPMLVKEEMQTFDAAQAAKFLEAAKSDRLYAMYVLAISTGMRQGELFTLKWSDIDIDARTLRVQRTITANAEIKPPKTKKSRRTVDLPAMAVEALQEHRKHRLAEGLAGSEWFFSDTKGGLLRRQNLMRRSYKPLLESAGLPVIRFHDLRHSCATIMLGAGINPKVVSESLGHSSVAFTLDTYAHVLPGMGRAAADVMGNLLAVKAS